MQLLNIQYYTELYHETIGNHVDVNYNYIMLITMTLSTHFNIVKVQSNEIT